MARGNGRRGRRAGKLVRAAQAQFWSMALFYRTIVLLSRNKIIKFGREQRRGDSVEANEAPANVFVLSEWLTKVWLEICRQRHGCSR